MFEKSKKHITAYIRREGDDEAVLVADGLEAMITPTIVRPPMPARIPDPNHVPDPANVNAPVPMIEDRGEMLIWEGEMKMIPRREAALKTGMVKAYATIWEQCSPVTRSKLEQLPGYDVLNRNKNPIDLLTECRNIVCGRESHQQPVYSMVQLVKSMALFFQQKEETNETYKENFEGMWDAIVQQGGSITSHPGLIAARALEIANENGRAAPNPADTATATANIEEETKACFMLSGAHNLRHKALKDYLENAYTLGDNKYPINTTELLSMMNNFRGADGKAKARTPAASNDGDDDGLNFCQEGETAETQGENGAQLLIAGATEHPPQEQPKTYAQVAKAKKGRKKGKKKQAKEEEDAAPKKAAKCIHCGGSHELSHCEHISDSDLLDILSQLKLAEEQKKKDEEEQANDSAANGNMLFQENKKDRTTGLRKNWLYLDTCTTHNQCVNSVYLSGIHEAINPLTTHTNSGSSSTKMQGYLGSVLFWLDRMGIANVVSLDSLEQKYHVKYDSLENDGAFICKTTDGEVIFKRCPDTKFPYVDLDEEGSENAVLLVQTVRKNYEGFTRREVERAILARKLQARAGHPSEATFRREANGSGANPRG